MPVQNVAHKLHFSIWKPMNTLSQSKSSGICFLLFHIHLYTCLAMVLKKPLMSMMNTTMSDSISKFMYSIFEIIFNFEKTLYEVFFNLIYMFAYG